MEFFSLEQRLKAYQNKSMANASDNVVTISTGNSSSMRLNNGGGGGGGGGSSGNNSDAYHGKQKFGTSVQTVSPKVLTTSNGTSTISLTGPVTDL